MGHQRELPACRIDALIDAFIFALVWVLMSQHCEYTGELRVGG